MELFILDFPYTLIADLTGCFGSTAVVQLNSSQMTGFGGIADAQKVFPATKFWPAAFVHEAVISTVKKTSLIRRAMRTDTRRQLSIGEGILLAVLRRTQIDVSLTKSNS